MSSTARISASWAVALLFAVGGWAQELSPRAYWPAPRGTKVWVIGYSYSSGDVVTDPSLPVAGVDSRINAGLAAYFQTLSLAGRTANVVVELPYSWGTTEGELAGVMRRRDFTGFGDVGLTLSTNFIGAPSMTPAEFQELRKNPRPIFGGSLKVVLPTGAYDPTKLINVSGNRLAAKFELGLTLPLRPRWLLETELGVWGFQGNDEFLGMTREQDPILAGEIHLVRRIRPGFWVSVELNYVFGGRTAVDGVGRADLQRNSRFGVTGAFPFPGGQAVKVGLSTGVVTASGGDFISGLVSYSRLIR